RPGRAGLPFRPGDRRGGRRRGRLRRHVHHRRRRARAVRQELWSCLVTIVPYIDRGAPFALGPVIALLGNEKEGLALDFVNMRAYVRDRSTPENQFLGDPNGLLTYSEPSSKYVANDAGVLIPGTTLRTDHLA